jgi:hypothetical protein
LEFRRLLLLNAERPKPTHPVLEEYRGVWPGQVSDFVKQHQYRLSDKTSSRKSKADNSFRRWFDQGTPGTLVILALALAITAGMVLTTAFAFGLLPLGRLLF